MISRIIVNSEFSLEDKMNVCDECLKLLTLRGTLKRTFIIRIEANKPVECDICGKSAKFVISPFSRGMWVCKKCLDERGKKHTWMNLKIAKYDEEALCDICFEKGAYLLVKEG